MTKKAVFLPLNTIIMLPRSVQQQLKAIYISAAEELKRQVKKSLTSVVKIRQRFNMTGNMYIK